jgi:hypothetical protein
VVPAGAGRDRGAFEQILEIAIVVAIQPSNADAFPVAHHLATNIAVLAAVVSFDGEPAVRPELSLGAKTVWCLQQRDQQCGTNRTDGRNLAQ